MVLFLMTSLPEKDVKYIFNLVEKQAKKRGLVMSYQNNNSQLRVSTDTNINNIDTAYMLVSKNINCVGFDVAYRVTFMVSGVCSGVEVTTKDMSDIDNFLEKAFEALQRDINKRKEIKDKKEKDRKALAKLRDMIPDGFINHVGVGKSGEDVYNISLNMLSLDQAERVLQQL